MSAAVRFCLLIRISYGKAEGFDECGANLVLCPVTGFDLLVAC
jgi:hypothetical protein